MLNQCLLLSLQLICKLHNLAYYALLAKPRTNYPCIAKHSYLEDAVHSSDDSTCNGSESSDAEGES